MDQNIQPLLARQRHTILHSLAGAALFTWLCSHSAPSFLHPAPLGSSVKTRVLFTSVIRPALHCPDPHTNNRRSMVTETSHICHFNMVVTSDTSSRWYALCPHLQKYCQEFMSFTELGTSFSAWQSSLPLMAFRAALSVLASTQNTAMG